MKTVERNTGNYDRIPLSALLYATRGTYTSAIQRAQAKVGCGDVPASGEPILSAVEWGNTSLESIIRKLGVTKQTAGEAVEMLVARGYLERTRDPEDRRKVNLSLTDRGKTAGKAARAAIEEVDRGLLARVGPESISHARATLVALLEIKREGMEDEEA